MKIIKKILASLFVVVSVMYAFIIISTHYNKDFYPFGIRVAIVLTESMAPELKKNDFVIIKKVEEVNIGDIVIYKEKKTGNEVIHRIVKIEGEKLTTKGDANNIEDKSINKTQIKGKYIGKIRFLGNIISFILKPIGLSITVTAVLIILLIPEKKKKE